MVLMLPNAVLMFNKKEFARLSHQSWTYTVQRSLLINKIQNESNSHLIMASLHAQSPFHRLMSYNTTAPIITYIHSTRTKLYNYNNVCVYYIENNSIELHYTNYTYMGTL